MGLINQIRYDQDGYVVNHKTTYPDGRTNEIKTSYEKDENGNILTYRREYIDSEGNKEVEETKYEYEKVEDIWVATKTIFNGNIINEVKYDLVDGKPSLTNSTAISYNYDDDGNLISKTICKVLQDDTGETVTVISERDTNDSILHSEVHVSDSNGIEIHSLNSDTNLNVDYTVIRDAKFSTRSTPELPVYSVIKTEISIEKEAKRTSKSSEVEYEVEYLENDDNHKLIKIIEGDITRYHLIKIEQREYGLVQCHYTSLDPNPTKDNSFTIKEELLDTDKNTNRVIYDYEDNKLLSCIEFGSDVSPELVTKEYTASCEIRYLYYPDKSLAMRTAIYSMPNLNTNEYHVIYIYNKDDNSEINITDTEIIFIMKDEQGREVLIFRDHITKEIFDFYYNKMISKIL